MGILNKTVYKNKWFEVISKHYIKEKKKYYTLKIPDSSVILPITKANEFIIIKQFRESLDDYSLELPAGFIEDNETSLYLFKAMMMNRTNSVQHLFVANNIIRKSLPKDSTEIIKINQSNLFKMISNNQFVQLSGQGLILKYLIHDKLI